MKIPIENIFYLLLYAWDHLEERDLIPASAEGTTEQLDFYARVLLSSVNRLLKRGLMRGYLPCEDELRVLRGKVSLSESLKRLSLPRGKISCSFDEFSPDLVANQMIRSTLRVLSNSELISPDLRRDTFKACEKFRSVSERCFIESDFNRVHLGSYNRHYRFPLRVCELLAKQLVVDERNGDTVFRDFLKDEKAMALLFQDFVFNFYKAHSAYRVEANHLSWEAEPIEGTPPGFLPRMETDISLYSDERKIVIDTKYYQNTLNSHENSEKIHSGNLYQIVSYLQSREYRRDPSWEGLLLYPTTQPVPPLKYRILDRRVSIRTINLNQRWEYIHNELLALVA